MQCFMIYFFSFRSSFFERKRVGKLCVGLREKRGGLFIEVGNKEIGEELKERMGIQ